ncbi:cyclin-dependent kinase 2 [Nematocida displodere]|uniref:Cyclin-dependent kinase 1 n=1 Tax=Nematocida displodere TaxID=1805483 RepID=A0A177ECY8_9MICR|nr:cyclin-dependent kinase 2 [Nematocida displodere]
MYKRNGKIAETGRSSVYTGQSLKDGKTIVLKKIAYFGGGAQADASAKRSRQEIAILKKAQHKNIIALIDIISNDALLGSSKPTKSLYIVMEHCEQTLADIIPTVTRPLRNSILFQILDGLEYIHSLNILHRDIKPSNILISHGTVKIADFGISRECSGTMTQLQGTLAYMAIEILLGSTAYTRTVDLWSLGCLFWEMTTHQICFPGTGQLDQIAKIVCTLGVTPEEALLLSGLPYGGLVKTPRPASSTLAELTEEDAAILSVLLSYNPAKRALSPSLLSRLL